MEHIFSCAFQPNRERVRENRKGAALGVVPTVQFELKNRRIKEVNRITEEQMRRETAPEVEFEVPQGVSPVASLKEYFGMSETPHDAMPADVDVENTVVVSFK